VSGVGQWQQAVAGRVFFFFFFLIFLKEIMVKYINTCFSCLMLMCQLLICGQKSLGFCQYLIEVILIQYISRDPLKEVKLIM